MTLTPGIRVFFLQGRKHPLRLGLGQEPVFPGKGRSLISTRCLTDHLVGSNVTKLLFFVTDILAKVATVLVPD